MTTNIFQKYRYFFIVLTHTCIVIIAYFLSYLLRFDFQVASYLLAFYKTLPLLVLIKIVTFFYFGLYNSSWRYVSIEDLWQIFKATFVSGIVFMVCVIIFYGLVGFPRSIFILDWGLCLGIIGGLRFAARLVKEKFNISALRLNGHRKVLIIGAGSAGILVLKECRSNPHIHYNIVGFIDDDLGKKKLSIHGIKVLGTRHLLPKIIEQNGIEEVIIAMPSAKGEVIRECIRYCQTPGIKIKIVPAIYKILDGQVQIKLREVQPEDLLGREGVQIDNNEILKYIKNKVVLITGAAGSIGSELSRQVASFSPQKLVLIDYNENDIYFLTFELKKHYPNLLLETFIGDVKDVGLLKNIFSKTRPQIVFHSAAHKHVPLMEENPAAAVKNNIIGTRNLIYAANHYKAESFVFISTDKAVNPKSVMGATKRIGEMLLQAKAKISKTRFIAVRFGNVLGSKGSVIPLFKTQIENGGPVTVTHPEATRFFMSIREAVQLVLQASTMGKGGEIFVLDMGEPIKIIELAKNLITLSGLKPDKDIAIKIIGLRAGEKMYEETLSDVEKGKTTKHKKIYIASPENFNVKKLNKNIKELEKLANVMEYKTIISKIETMVAFYKSDKKKDDYAKF